MKRLFPIIIVLLVVVLSGCTGRDTSSEMNGQIFERANLNLNGKMMDIQLMPNDARAGEKITANLVVGNTGSESISSAKIEIKAKAKSLDDTLANIAIMLMSPEKKTITFSKDYNEEIKTGMIKPFTQDFPTPKELRDRSLSGIYEVTIILSVNGQQVESKSMNLKLRSGKPRDGSNTPGDTSSGTVSSTSTPMVTASASSATTVTAAPTPTPTQVPKVEEVTVDTFLFGWNDVPGKDSSKLKGYLKNKYGVDWIENAIIEKSSDDKNINITSGNNYIYLTIDDYKTIVSMVIDDGRKAEFSGVMVDGKLNIYSGIVVYTRIMGWKFTETNLKLDAGSWLQWRNMDDEAIFTLTEANGKLPNITVRSRTYFYFNTTGIYKFDVHYPKMRETPLSQTITVTLNQSQQ